MKKSLLLLGVIAALAIGVPAYSQAIWFDVDGNGVCNSLDVLTSSTTAVDVWLDTNHNAAGTLVTCVDPTAVLDITSYDLVIHKGTSGSVAYSAITPWTNSLTGFTQQPNTNFTVAGNDAGLTYSSAGYLAEGKYKLGTLNVTVTGTPVLTFLDLSPDPSLPSFGTGFGSHCPGSGPPYTISLGPDFTDACGTASTTLTESTTWGKIKQLYR